MSDQKIKPEERIQPGVFILSKDVTNPDADRRKKHDWRKAPLWKSGMRFVVHHEHESHDYGDRKVEFTIVTITPEGGHRSINAGAHPDQFNALVPALTPAMRTLETVMHGQGMYTNGGYEAVVRYLLKKGKINLPDVAEAIADSEDEPVMDKLALFQKDPDQAP